MYGIIELYNTIGYLQLHVYATRRAYWNAGHKGYVQDSPIARTDRNNWCIHTRCPSHLP